MRNSSFHILPLCFEDYCQSINLMISFIPNSVDPQFLGPEILTDLIQTYLRSLLAVTRSVSKGSSPYLIYWLRVELYPWVATGLSNTISTTTSSIFCANTLHAPCVKLDQNQIPRTLGVEAQSPTITVIVKFRWSYTD